MSSPDTYVSAPDIHVFPPDTYVSWPDTYVSSPNTNFVSARHIMSSEPLAARRRSRRRRKNRKKKKEARRFSRPHENLFFAPSRQKAPPRLLGTSEYVAEKSFDKLRYNHEEEVLCQVTHLSLPG